MSNETDKPLAGALRAVRKADGVLGNSCLLCTRGRTCPVCAEEARIIARESGLAELVEAVEKAEETRHCDYLVIDDSGDMARQAMIAEDDWLRIVAAARRVREGYELLQR